MTLSRALFALLLPALVALGAAGGAQAQGVWRELEELTAATAAKERAANMPASPMPDRCVNRDSPCLSQLIESGWKLGFHGEDRWVDDAEFDVAVVTSNDHWKFCIVARGHGQRTEFPCSDLQRAKD